MLKGLHGSPKPLITLVILRHEEQAQPLPVTLLEWGPKRHRWGWGHRGQIPPFSPSGHSGLSAAGTQLKQRETRAAAGGQGTALNDAQLPGLLGKGLRESALSFLWIHTESTHPSALFVRDFWESAGQRTLSPETTAVFGAQAGIQTSPTKAPNPPGLLSVA